MEYRASTPGKVIITGEHAVVYGHLAVAASINIRTEIKLKILESEEKIIINFKDTQNIIPWDQISSFKDKISIEGIVSLLISESSVPKKTYIFDIKSSLPIGAGLGSSASFCVGVAGVLLKSKNIEDLEEINKLAFIGETLIHGRASGIDNTVVTYGGVISYQKGEIKKIEISNFPLKFLLVNSGQPKNTKTMVEKLRKNRENLPDVYSHLFLAVEAISLELLDAVSQNNTEKFKECLRINHQVLRAFDVCGNVLEEIVESASRLGIKGKMTGGGGGGTCVFAVSDEDTRRFQEICRERGWEILMADLSPVGIIIESYSI